MPVFDTFTIQAPNTSDTTRAFALKQNAINSLMQPLNNLTKLAERSAQAEQANRAAQVMAHLQGYTTPDSYLSALQNEDLTGLTPEAVKAITMDRPDQLRNAILNERKVADAEKRTDLYGQLGFGNLRNDINRTEIMNKRLPIEQTTADAAMENARAHAKSAGTQAELAQSTLEDAKRKRESEDALLAAQQFTDRLKRAYALGSSYLAEQEYQKIRKENPNMRPETLTALNNYMQEAKLSLTPVEGQEEDIATVLGFGRANPIYTDKNGNAIVINGQVSRRNQKQAAIGTLTNLKTIVQELEKQGFSSDFNAQTDYKDLDSFIKKEKELYGDEVYSREIVNKARDIYNLLTAVAPAGTPKSAIFNYISANARGNHIRVLWDDYHLAKDTKDAKKELTNTFLQWFDKTRQHAQASQAMRQIQSALENKQTVEDIAPTMKEFMDRGVNLPDFQKLDPATQLKILARQASSYTPGIKNTDNAIRVGDEIVARANAAAKAAAEAEEEKRRKAAEALAKAAGTTSDVLQKLKDRDLDTDVFAPYQG